MATTPPPPSDPPPLRPLTAWQAILAGQLVVNLPVAALFYGVHALVGTLAPADQTGYWMQLIAAFVTSMAWGMYASPRWQRWAMRRGVKVADLHRLAGMTLLMMPRATPREPPPLPRPKKPKQK